jgi:hypothetical protein
MLELTKRLMTLFGNGDCWFVEAGAHDGVGDSQTLELEGWGWKGLCVEPSSAYKGLTESRKCKTSNTVLAGHNGECIFREIGCGNIELSGIEAEFKEDGWRDEREKSHRNDIRECVTLDVLLASHEMPKVIQFLSLDTEGSEMTILRAHSQVEFRFLSAQIEHNNVKSQQTAILEYMVQRGFHLAHRDPVNDFYLLPKEMWV